MSFTDFTLALGMSEAPQPWAEHYPLSSQKLAVVKASLEQAGLESAMAGIGLDAGLTTAVLECARMVSADVSLLHFLGLWDAVLFESFDSAAIYDEQYGTWPLPGKLSDQQKDVFRALVLIRHWDAMEARLAKRGLADHVPYSAQVFRGTAEEHFKVSGCFGLSNENLWWLWSFVLGRLFRLGLLEFEIIRFNLPFQVYSDSRGRHQALCSGDWTAFDDSGYPVTGEGFHPPFLDRGDSVEGCGFTPCGTLDRKPVVLDKGKWFPAVGWESHVLNIHIPGDGKLTPNKVGESLELAKDFFPRYFPEIDARAFVCDSWLLDYGLDKFLPSHSNILAFQRFFTLIMSHPDDKCLFDFIFQTPPCSIDQLKPRNEFHHKILAHVKGGGQLRDGFGYILI